MSSLKPLTNQPLLHECWICREEIHDDLLKLNHKVNEFVHCFHNECAKDWLKEHPTCPACSVEASPDQVLPIMIASNTLSLEYASNLFSEALKSQNEDILEHLIAHIPRQPELGPKLLSQVISGHDVLFDRIKPLCDRALTSTHRTLAQHSISKNNLEELVYTIENSPDKKATIQTLLFYSVGMFTCDFCDLEIPKYLLENFGGDFNLREIMPCIGMLLNKNEFGILELILLNTALEPEIKERIRKEITKYKATDHAVKLIREKNLKALETIVKTGNLDDFASDLFDAIIENLEELPNFLLDLCSKGSIFSLTYKAFKSKKLKLCLQILCATQDEFSARHICELCLKENLIDFYKDLLKRIKFKDPSTLVWDATREKSFEGSLAIINQYELDGYSTLLLFQLAIKERNISFIKTLIAQCSFTSSIPKPFEEKRKDAWEIKGILGSLANFITEEKQLELAREFFNRNPIDRELFAEFLSFFKENAKEVFTLIPERIRESVLMIATLENPYNLDHLKVLFDDEFVNDALIQFVLRDTRSIPPEILCHKALKEETIKEAIEIARENGNESLVDTLIFRLPILEASLYRLLYVQCTIS
jgi:hypothetical protein